MLTTERLLPSTRTCWVVAAVTLVALDTLTTAVAVEAGLGVEGNPLLVPLVAADQWFALGVLKGLVVTAVWLVWRLAPQGSWHTTLPRGAAALGVAIVASNTLMIFGSASLGGPA